MAPVSSTGQALSVHARPCKHVPDLIGDDAAGFPIVIPANAGIQGVRDEDGFPRKRE